MGIIVELKGPRKWLKLNRNFLTIPGTHNMNGQSPMGCGTL